MKSLIIFFVGLSMCLLAEGMILAELFGYNRIVTALFYAVGGGCCVWYLFRQVILKRSS